MLKPSVSCRKCIISGGRADYSPEIMTTFGIEIFLGMKRKLLFHTGFWLVAVIVLGLIFKSGCSSYSVAFLYAAMILPAMLMASHLHRQLSFEDLWKGIWHSMCLCAAVLAAAYLGMGVCGWYLNKYTVGSIFMLNPVLLLFVIASCCLLEWVLEKHILAVAAQDDATADMVEFISERKKVEMEISRIKYIESNDSEVWVRCTGGESFRTKMNISRWESLLGERFERIHRSFLVNKDAITLSETTQVHLGEEVLPVSRKYRK